LTWPTADAAYQGLSEAGCDATSVLVVDLIELTFIDVTGINVLHRAHRTAAAQGARLVLVSPQRTVRRVIDTLELKELIISRDRLLVSGARDPATPAA
jgi:anti-anti-sigma factor